MKSLVKNLQIQNWNSTRNSFNFKPNFKHDEKISQKC